MATETQPIAVQWPKAVRLPVVLNFEHHSGESAPTRPGDRPQRQCSDQMEYGARRGIRNILEMLDELGIRATFFVSGVTAEKFPETVRAAHAAGHEIAGMGYSFEKVRTASREREEAIVRRAKKALADVCGVEIKGWRCPDYRISPQTFDVLSAEGFVWDSSMLNDDLPYQLECEAESLIEIPFTTTTSEKSHVAFPYPMRGGPSGLPMSGTTNSTFSIAKARARDF